MKFKHYSIFITFSLLFLLVTQCRKKDNFLFDSSAKLELATDSILFDTVFTTIGSTTKKFIIRNNNNRPLIISNVSLDKSSASNFRFNVDGFPGPNIKDVEIGANDSLFVFVEVTVDPNNSNNPVVITDKLTFETNGNRQSVLLEAWGQDAYFHVNELLQGNFTWQNDKPHVIYGLVAIDEGSELNILPGTIVHGHVNSTIIVYKSTLNVNGTFTQPIEFRGDRLENFNIYDYSSGNEITLDYADSITGQWRGIYFFGAKESTIEHTVIKNAVVGIQIDTLSANEFVNLNKVKIENSLAAALFTQGANVKAENCLFGSGGQYSAAITIGGDLTFNHCTFGNYDSGGSFRKTPALLVKNYFEDRFENNIPRPFDQALFTNSIVYGNIDNELEIDTLNRSVASIPNFMFTNCLIKQEEFNENTSFFNGTVINQDPLFIDPTNTWNFRLKSGSAAIGKADVTIPTLLNDDLDNKSRDGNPDIGCYER